MTKHTGTQNQTHREVGQRRIAAGDARTILMRRRYEAPIADVWAACTDPDRLSRFFLRPTGDLREGGSFSLEGNASGDIVRCDPPHRLSLTWVYADRPVDEVELRLSPTDDGATVFELEHASILRMVTLDDGREVDVVLNDPISGIFGLGTGWELSLITLDLYLRGQMPDDPAAFMESPDLPAIIDECGRGWAAAVAVAGSAAGDLTASR